MSTGTEVIKAIILEDEAIAARRLERMLSELDGHPIEVSKTFATVASLHKYLVTEGEPDLLFLDIMVADGNSFELFDLMEVHCPIIFVTAYDEFAIKAFRKHALDYLLKPIKKDQLQDAVNRLKKESGVKVQEVKEELSPYKSRYLIRFANKLTTVEVKDIAFIHSQDKMAFFYLRTGERIASDLRLQDLIEELDPHLFIRANRQFIIHRDAIDEIFIHSRSRLKVELKPSTPETLIISTEMTPVFKSWLDPEAG